MTCSTVGGDICFSSISLPVVIPTQEVLILRGPKKSKHLLHEGVRQHTLTRVHTPADNKQKPKEMEKTHGPFRGEGAQEQAWAHGTHVVMTYNGRKREYWSYNTVKARQAHAQKLIKEGWEVNERVNGTKPAQFFLDVDGAPGAEGVLPALEATWVSLAKELGVPKHLRTPHIISGSREEKVSYHLVSDGWTLKNGAQAKEAQRWFQRQYGDIIDVCASESSYGLRILGSAKAGKPEALLRLERSPTNRAEDMWLQGEPTEWKVDLGETKLPSLKLVKKAAGGAGGPVDLLQAALDEMERGETPKLAERPMLGDEHVDVVTGETMPLDLEAVQMVFRYLPMPPKNYDWVTKYLLNVKSLLERSPEAEERLWEIFDRWSARDREAYSAGKNRSIWDEKGVDACARGSFANLLKEARELIGLKTSRFGSASEAATSVSFGTHKTDGLVPIFVDGVVPKLTLWGHNNEKNEDVWGDVMREAGGIVDPIEVSQKIVNTLAYIVSTGTYRKRELSPWATKEWPLYMFGSFTSFSYDDRLTLRWKKEEEGHTTTLKTIVSHLKGSLTYHDEAYVPTPPGETTVLTGDTRRRTLNLFQGWASPVLDRPSDPSVTAPWLDLLRQVWCNDNAELYEYVVRWFAHLVQRPGVPVGTTLIVAGEQGIGKGLPVEWFSEAVLGLENAYISQGDGDLVGDFNVHLTKKVLVTFDEVRLKGRETDKLKHMVTSAVQEAHEKGRTKRTVRNTASFVLLSNHDKVLYDTTAAGRRWVHCDTREEPFEREYYDRAVAGLQTPGAAADVMTFLAREVDLAGWNPRTIPTTEKRAVLAADPHQHLKDYLQERFMTELASGATEIEVVQRDLRTGYLEWVERHHLQGEVHVPDSTRFAKLLRQAGLRKDDAGGAGKRSRAGMRVLLDLSVVK